MRAARLETAIPRWLAWVAVLLAFACGMAAAAALARHLLPLGLPATWVWKLRETAVSLFPWKAVAGGALLVVALMAFDALRTGKAPSRAFTAVLLLALTLASASLMVATMADEREYPYRATAAILGDLSMGYYIKARDIADLRPYIADTPARTRLGTAPERVVTHPPGPVVFAWASRHWLLNHPEVLRTVRLRLEGWTGDRGLAATLQLVRRVCTKPVTTDDLVLALAPMLALTMSACLVVPLVFTLAVVVSDRRLALAAAALATAIPSLVAFNPSIDGWIAVICTATITAGCAALRLRSMPLALLCGVLWAYGCFWSFGVAALAAVLAIHALATRSHSPVRPLTAGLGVLAGFGLAHIALWALLGYDPVSSFAASLQAQSQVMAHNHRPYLASIPWNLYDFALFTGPALVVMAAIGALLGRAAGSAARGAASLGLAAIATVLLLAAAGSTRGEVGRIWALMMPMLVPAAALPLLPLRGWSLISAGMLVLGAQVALTIAINSHLALVSP